MRLLTAKIKTNVVLVHNRIATFRFILTIDEWTRCPSSVDVSNPYYAVGRETGMIVCQVQRPFLCQITTMRPSFADKDEGFRYVFFSFVFRAGRGDNYVARLEKPSGFVTNPHTYKMHVAPS